MDDTASRDDEVDLSGGLVNSATDVEIATYLYDMLMEMQQMCAGRQMRVVSKAINFAGEEVRRYLVSKLGD
ncbi:MAG: hypothetical protein V3V30_00505 [Parvularculaceae bacterium]